MTLHVIRLDEPRHPGKSLYIDTVRRPLHGVPREGFTSRDLYDAWMPLLSPTPELAKRTLAARGVHGGKGWNTFVHHFRIEMRDGDAARLLDMLVAFSCQTSLSVRCYCEDEAHCHRSVLRALSKERRAKLIS